MEYKKKIIHDLYNSSQYLRQQWRLFITAAQNVQKVYVTSLLLLDSSKCINWKTIHCELIVYFWFTEV